VSSYIAFGKNDNGSSKQGGRARVHTTARRRSVETRGNGLVIFLNHACRSLRHETLLTMGKRTKRQQPTHNDNHGTTLLNAAPTKCIAVSFLSKRRRKRYRRKSSLTPVIGNEGKAILLALGGFQDENSDSKRTTHHLSVQQQNRDASSSNLVRQHNVISRAGIRSVAAADSEQ